MSRRPKKPRPPKGSQIEKRQLEGEHGKISRNRKRKPPPNSQTREEQPATRTPDVLEVASEAIGSIGRKDAPTARLFGPWDWLFAVALVVAVFLAYQPAWRGGLLWDDESHVTRPELQSLHGLYRVWFDVGATLQYYPLLHSAFWLEHELWGDATLGYHLINIALHALAAILVLAILRHLELPGAHLAAAIFALHPVHVESVAWITEQKNTLSAVFYLGAAMLYLRFDQTRKLKWYLGAAGLFVLALPCKTVTGTLPGALLVICWWRRGRLSWKQDVLPLVPLFLLGAGAGMITAWWELKINQCVGPEFAFTFAQRLLIAGRTAWFCLWKLIWPAELTFIYPRWQIDAGVWWQWLFPLGAAGLLAAAWAIRRWSRAPLAAILFFGGTLFPVLGFFSLYTFKYSLVADHYQYLASLGVIALFSAEAALLLRRVDGWQRIAEQAAAVALLAVLAVLSWRQSRMYGDIQTLYEATIDRNPDCLMAHNNLGNVLGGRGQVDEAIAHYQKALDIEPDDVDALNNLGNALAGRGQVDEAIAQYQKALEFEPGNAVAHYNLGNALASRGKVDEAIAHYQKALEIKPDYTKARCNLATALAGSGQVDEAIAHWRKALEINPDDAEVHNNLGLGLACRGQIDEAIAHYRRAAEIKPDFAAAYFNNGNALAGRGQLGEAIACYRKALKIKPDYLEAHGNLGLALAGCGQFDEAIAHYRKASEIKPDDAKAHCNLGTALAGRGQIDEAMEHFQKALDLATARDDPALADVIRAQIRRHQSTAPSHAAPLRKQFP